MDQVAGDANYEYVSESFKEEVANIKTKINEMERNMALVKDSCRCQKPVASRLGLQL